MLTRGFMLRPLVRVRGLSSSVPRMVVDVLHPGGPGVSDAIRLLPTDTKQSVEHRIKNLRSKTGVEMAVVIVNDTQSHAKQAGYSRFTRSIFDTWGIGRAEVNDVVRDRCWRGASDSDGRMVSGHGTHGVIGRGSGLGGDSGILHSPAFPCSTLERSN
jgi:hypothetical protein